MANKTPKRKHSKLRFSQECIDLILEGTTELKSKTAIARDVAARYGIGVEGARYRVECVWTAIEREAKGERSLNRHKISGALIAIYQDCRSDAKLENWLKLLQDAGAGPEHIGRILSKWDPYKSLKLALQALDQFTKLHGAQAAEKIEVKNTHEFSRDPMSLTPQERRKRITELMSSGKIKVVADEQRGPGRSRKADVN